MSGRVHDVPKKTVAGTKPAKSMGKMQGKPCVDMPNFNMDDIRVEFGMNKAGTGMYYDLFDISAQVIEEGAAGAFKALCLRVTAEHRHESCGGL